MLLFEDWMTSILDNNDIERQNKVNFRKCVDVFVGCFFVSVAIHLRVTRLSKVGECIFCLKLQRSVNLVCNVFSVESINNISYV